MKREELQEKLVAVLSEAVKEGFLHRMVFMADTTEHHMLLTNMGQKSTTSFVLHMALHALDGRSDHTVVYNLSTGEVHTGEEAEEMATAVNEGRTPRGNGRRKKAH